MKLIIAFAVLIAVAVARPNEQDSQAQVIHQTSDVNPDGSYANSLKTSNGIDQEEHGELKQVPGAEEPSLAVHGRYTYTAPDGTPVEVEYTADENGFQPRGKHLPVA